MRTVFKRDNWSVFAVLLVIAVVVIVNRWQGRLWFCECGHPRPWVSEADGSHTSQHLADPYSLTHFQHGLVLCAIVSWCAGGWSWPWQRWLAITIEGAWEIVENTSLVIDRYRDATAALGYTGDTIWNSVGDILACWVGLELARRVGWRWSVALFIAIELLLLATIRDSLLLNVVMLLCPLEFIKAWQVA